MYYEFSESDVFVNTVKAHPQFEIFYYLGKTVINAGLGQQTNIDPEYINLYELNVNRAPGEELIYSFIPKDGTHFNWKTISKIIDQKDSNTEYSDQYGTGSYGDIIKQLYPLTSSVYRKYYTAVDPRPHLDALQNTLRHYKPQNAHYDYSSYYSGSTVVNFFDIPSIFFGSSIKKGSVSLKYFLTGTLIGEARDIRNNGSLIHVSGAYGNVPLGTVVGTVLYKEGALLITSSSDLISGSTDAYTIANSEPKWVYFGDHKTTAISSSYSLSFKGTTKTQVLTMFAHAKKQELNFSSNPTFLQYGQSFLTGTTVLSGTAGVFHDKFKEPENITIKNTVSSSYCGVTGSFEKQTFISKIGLYDEDRNLVGVVKLATPVRKTEARDYTFKIKLDI